MCVRSRSRALGREAGCRTPSIASNHALRRCASSCPRAGETAGRDDSHPPRLVRPPLFGVLRLSFHQLCTRADALIEGHEWMDARMPAAQSPTPLHVASQDTRVAASIAPRSYGPRTTAVSSPPSPPASKIRPFQPSMILSCMPSARYVGMSRTSRLPLGGHLRRQKRWRIRPAAISRGRNRSCITTPEGRPSSTRRPTLA